MSLTAQLNTVQNAKEGELELSTQSVGRICADRRSQAVIRVLADYGPLSFESLATAVARRYHDVTDINTIDSDLRQENRAILHHKALPELDNQQVIKHNEKIRLDISEDAADVLLAVIDIMSHLCME